MRRAGDNHSSAQEGVGGSLHPGPLSILLSRINRNNASLNKRIAHPLCCAGACGKCDLGEVMMMGDVKTQFIPNTWFNRTEVMTAWGRVCQFRRQILLSCHSSIMVLVSYLASYSLLLCSRSVFTVMFPVLFCSQYVVSTITCCCQPLPFYYYYYQILVSDSALPSLSAFWSFPCFWHKLWQTLYFACH